MKKYLLLLFLAVPGVNSADSIPNAGFEYWIFAGWGVNPLSWNVNNSQIVAANVVPDSLSYSGILAMRLINSGNFRPYAACGFPITVHPSALQGYLKNELAFNDTALLRILVYDGGLVVDSGHQLLIGGILPPGYIHFIVPVSQNSVAADSCEIIFEGGNDYLSMVSFDDLTLADPSGIDETEKELLHAYPNPFSDAITLSFGDAQHPEMVTLYDCSGRMIIEYPTSGRELKIDTSTLPGGLYFLAATWKDRVIGTKLVKYPE